MPWQLPSGFWQLPAAPDAFLAAAGSDPCVMLWNWPPSECIAELSAAAPAVALGWGFGAEAGFMVASVGARCWCELRGATPSISFNVCAIDLSSIAAEGAQQVVDLSCAGDAD